MIRAEAIDPTSVNQRMRSFAEETGREIFDEIIITARVIARSLATSTQPYGLGRGALMAGRKRVAMDIGKVFTTPSGFYAALEDEDPAAAAQFWQAWKSRDLTAAKDIASKTRAGSGLDISQRPSYQHHQSRRGSGGRVHGKRATSLVLDPQALADYRRQIQNRVGITKAGWAGAAESAGAGGGFPAWASTAHSPMRGRATKNESLTTPEVVLHNDVEWARESLPAAEEQAAVDIAEARLLNRIQIILDKASEDPF